AELAHQFPVRPAKPDIVFSDNEDALATPAIPFDPLRIVAAAAKTSGEAPHDSASVRTSRSTTAPITEAARSLPWRPMLAASRSAATPCWSNNDSATQASSRIASIIEPVLAPWVNTSPARP